MAGRKFHKNRFNRSQSFLSSRVILVREKKLIEINYGFLNCHILNNKLICIGKTKPTPYSVEYEFKIVYDGIYSPRVFINSPEIIYNDEIHMFSNDMSLCLFHRETDNFYWNFRKHNLYDTIIPWALEWFIYYELYLISGKWEHPHIDHRLNYN
ncbi:hypothetical protein C7972_10219 [Arenibacter sp. ARW7G5Y1]|nr:hypothetical protein C7972_10219 [Arenibacter sp. ARW7G5Y1]